MHLIFLFICNIVIIYAAEAEGPETIGLFLEFFVILVVTR